MSFEVNERETRQEEDAFMEEETPNAGELKVAKMRHKVLPSSTEKKNILISNRTYMSLIATKKKKTMAKRKHSVIN